MSHCVGDKTDIKIQIPSLLDKYKAKVNLSSSLFPFLLFSFSFTSSFVIKESQT